MSGVDVPGNGIGVRLASLERKVDRLEGLEPAVVKQQVADIKEDIHQLAHEMAYIRKILTGFLATFAISGIVIVVSVLSITQGG